MSKSDKSSKNKSMSTTPAPGWPGVDETRRKVMRANPRRDTRPELLLKSLLRKHRLSFKADAKGSGVRFRADFLFPQARVALFVDGCFWHACPEHWTPSKTRPDYWKEKARANRLRDRRATKAYVEAGWVVIRIWEHNLHLAPDLVRFLILRIRASMVSPRNLPEQLAQLGAFQ